MSPPNAVNTMNLNRRIFHIDMEVLLAAAGAQRINRRMLQRDYDILVVFVALYQPFPPVDNGLLPGP
jgi:hypothetical protein